MSSILDRRDFLIRLVGAGSALLAIPGRAEVKWQVEMVESTGEGKFSSMRIDADGNIHLAYVIDAGDYPLMYAYRDKRLGKWFRMNVAKGVGMCALALDPKQQPHISYADYGSMSGAKLRHAYWDGTQWHQEPIRLESDVIAYYNSIAFDRDGHPSLTFYEYRGPKDSEISIRLRNVTFNGRFWEARYVDPDGGSGKFNGMATDPQGGLHIGYANVSFGDMRYAYWNGTSWIPEMVEEHSPTAGTYLGYSAAIAVDAKGTPHLTYADPNNRIIKYAVRRDGRWAIQAVDKVKGVGYPDRNSIALDAEGRVYLSYHDSGRGTMKLAFQEDGRWLVATIDGDNSGFTSSMQIHDGEIWLSYAAGSVGLKVAHTSVESMREAALSQTAAERQAAK